jgi:hypothetical protein
MSRFHQAFNVRRGARGAAEFPRSKRMRMIMSKCNPEGKRAGNRAAFPETAKIVDLFRAEFGDGVQLIYAEENGATIGKKLCGVAKFSTAGQWLKGCNLVKAELERRLIKPAFPSLNQMGRTRR